MLMRKLMIMLLLLMWLLLLKLHCNEDVVSDNINTAVVDDCGIDAGAGSVTATAAAAADDNDDGPDYLADNDATDADTAAGEDNTILLLLPMTTRLLIMTMLLRTLNK